MSPTVYLGGGHDFLSEIGLFRKLAGTDLFASRVKSGSSIELGENVQLRSIVRAGDGEFMTSQSLVPFSTAMACSSCHHRLSSFLKKAKIN